MKDALGLSLTDMTSAMVEWPFIIVYADAGFGKSTCMARAFAGTVGQPGALFLTTNNQVLRPYASWCREYPEAVRALNMRTVYEWNPAWTPEKAKGKTPTELSPFLDGLGGAALKQRQYDKGGVAIKVVPKLSPADVRAKAPNIELAYRIIEAYGDGKAKGVVPYSGLAWDEGTEFFRRWSGEIEDVDDWITKVAPISATRDELKKNPFARRAATNEFIDWFVNVPRTLCCFMCLVCHPADPTYFGQVKTDPVQRIGQLKYRGGPQLSTGPLRAAVSAIADAVLEGVVKPGGVRVWRTKLTDTQLRKFRDFGVGEEFALEHFHWALWRAGYKVPRPLGDPPAFVTAPAGTEVADDPTAML